MTKIWNKQKEIHEILKDKGIIKSKLKNKIDLRFESDILFIFNRLAVI